MDNEPDILEKYRQLIENANDAILIMDYESGYFIEANYKSGELTGYSRNELLKMGIERIYPRADYKRVMAGFQKAVEGPPCLLSNILILRKDGSSALADIGINAIEHDGQKIVQGIYRDVTERKKLEDELKETKDFMETLIDNLPISLLLFDEGPKLVYANEHFYQKSRKTRDIIGKEIRWVFRKLLPRETINEIEYNIKEGIRTGLPSEGRLMKHGKFYFSKVCPIKVKRKVKSVLLLEDVTEKARLEQEIREYSEHLEQMVEERTKELTESQAKLIQAGKMAGIGTLAGGIAHEVNNPLASILTYAQLLQTMSKNNSLTEKKTVKYAKEMEKVVKHCKSTIENLLDFSRASDEIEQSLSLANVLEDSVSLIRHQLNLQNVKVVKKCEDATVVGNKNQLQQVFVNLLK
ncbi:PAS domain S-box protein, partial [archaeon]|nr:PAS domain S-box protein [archaeon]